MIYEYPVLFDNQDTTITSQSVTILITNNGQALQLTGDLPPPYVSSNMSLTPELDNILRTMPKPKGPTSGKKVKAQDASQLAV